MNHSLTKLIEGFGARQLNSPQHTNLIKPRLSPTHFSVTGLIVGPTPPSSTEGCRVAPYVNMPSLRMAFDRLHMQHLGSHFDTLAAAAAASAAAAAATSPLAAAAAAALPPPAAVTSSSPVLPGSATSPLQSPLPSPLPSMLFYPTPHYAVNFAALAQNGLLSNKNSSIADLRLKAKHHAASLGLS